MLGGVRSICELLLPEWRLFSEAYDSQAFIFRSDLADEKPIKLSDEHSRYKFVGLESISAVQKIRVQNCLEYSGMVIGRRFQKL